MMYKIDVGRRIVFTTMTGVLSFEQVVAHAVALKGDSQFHPSFSELLDLRGVTQSELTSEELVRLAHTIDPFSPRARRAIVTGSEPMYGTSRMYQALREQESNIRVFRRMDEAHSWLGLARDSDAEERQSA